MSLRGTLTLTGISCLLLAASSPAQTQMFAPANDVSFVVSTERASYGRETVTLRYAIVNISNVPLYVPHAWDAKCPRSPHILVLFEDSVGQHVMPGYGGSCIPSSFPSTFPDRMKAETTLLQPGERFEDTISLDETLFDRLPRGACRIEAMLTGWKDDDFTDDQRKELAGMGHPFLRGQIPASTRITLTR